MDKIPLIWKPVKNKSVRGSDYESTFPELLEAIYRGTLVLRILSMPAKTSIAFAAAAVMCEDKMHEARHAGRVGCDTGEHFWFAQNFVSWISDQGFHIELTGDEFEPYAMSDKLV